jgi:hypothetical protein
MKKINQMIRRHTAFKGLIDLCKSAKHPYRPSLQCNSASGTVQRELTAIADAYDAMMQRLGINKTAFRF